MRVSRASAFRALVPVVALASFFLGLFAILGVFAGCSSAGRAKTDGAAAFGAHAYWENGPGVDLKAKVPSLDIGAGGAVADPIHGGAPAATVPVDPAPARAPAPATCDPNDPRSPCTVPPAPPAPAPVVTHPAPPAPPVAASAPAAAPPSSSPPEGHPAGSGDVPWGALGIFVAALAVLFAVAYVKARRNAAIPITKAAGA